MWALKLLVFFLFINFNFKITSCSNSSSLVYVIDETFSMTNDMKEVKKQAKEILLLTEKYRDISDYVLVSVHDPVVIVKSKVNSSKAFDVDLSHTTASDRHNGNCGEPILTGIIKGLEESKPGSSVYVFTDATASDYDKVNEVKSLSQHKQSQIMFMITNTCPNPDPNDKKIMVFYEIAAASGGIVVHMKHHYLEKSLDFFKELLANEYSAINSQVFGQSTTNHHENTTQFTVAENDDSVLVSVSGEKLSLGLLFVEDKTKPKIKVIKWTTNLKVLKIYNPKPGNYMARVAGIGMTSYVVYTRTGFTFEYGFSEVEPKSIEATSKQPTRGTIQHLSLNITDPKNNVEIKSVQILDKNERVVIMELSLRKTNENLYITDAFKFFDYTFKIKVLAEIKNPREPVYKISKIVYPKVVNRSPVITNEITQYYAVKGDNAVVIQCNAEGYPEPNIVWERVANSSDDLNFIMKENVLKITDLSNQTIQFECIANNDHGVARKIFTVHVTSGTFNNEPNYYGQTQDQYVVGRGTVTIPCNNKHSNETSSVRWYRNGFPTNKTGNEYVIENISIMDEGNYTCRANTNEGTEVKNYVLDVGSPPKFVGENPIDNVINWTNDDSFMDCEARAQPALKIEWTHNGVKVDRLMNVENIRVTDWGVYECNVSNIHGRIHRKFEVITKGCYIKNNMDDRVPLIVEQNTWPSNINTKEILLKKNATIELACLNNKKSLNTFQSFPGKSIITAQCHTQDRLSFDGNTYPYKNFLCEAPVEPSVINTHEECAGAGSEKIRVGFEVKNFVEAYTVCYNTTKNVPLYANAFKHGVKRLGYIDTSAFKWISVPGQDHDNTAGGFTCGATNKCCYSKGQLLEADEFPSGPAQAAAFTENLNSVAIWNHCNDSSGRMSWRQFQEKMTSISNRYFGWYTWTGASEYVSKDVGLVPRYMWKMVKYEEDDETFYIAMVYVNDESPNDTDILCTKHCDPIFFSDDKYIYCCNLEEFSEVFGIASENFRAI